LNPAQQEQRIKEESRKYFEENCVKPLERIANRPKRLKWVWVSSMAVHLFVHAFIELSMVVQREHVDALARLVLFTKQLVHDDVQVQEALSAALRVGADAKVESCIA
jgi:hypothetical protein